MCLLARSKLTLVSLTQKLEEDIRNEMDDPENLKVIKLNSTLNNSENKIQAKFCEALGLDRSITAIEMVEAVHNYFESNPELSILFIFEDIDYYVETTKQMMLYKILDLLQHAQIKFCFLATSMKHDVADSFEKRIKSRFSHKQVLFYDLSLELFKQ